MYLEICEVAGGDANVICIAVFIVGDGEFALAVFGACGYISSPAALYPPHKWLYEEGEEKGGKRVPLEGAPMDRNLRGKSMRGDICGGRGPVELLACPHVAFWQTECPHGLKHTFVVRAVNGPFEVYKGSVYRFFGGLGVF